jgi:hypothetical protein
VNRHAVNAVRVGSLLILGGLIVVVDPQCKCGCRTVGEHLIKVGVGLIVNFMA